MTDSTLFQENIGVDYKDAVELELLKWLARMNRGAWYVTIGVNLPDLLMGIYYDDYKHHKGVPGLKKAYCIFKPLLSLDRWQKAL